jgi:hypothetical protein
MGHATLLDVFNQGARFVSNIADTYSREKKFLADMEGENQWNILQKDIETGLLEYANSNTESGDDPVDLEGKFSDYVNKRLQSWEDQAFTRGNSRYYTNMINSLKAQGEVRLRSGLLRERWVKEKKRGIDLLDKNLESRLGSGDGTITKLESGLKDIDAAYNSNAIDEQTRYRYRNNYIHQTAQRTFQNIADAAGNVDGLAAALDEEAAIEDYKKYDPDIDIKAYRDQAYKEGERRIQQAVQTNLQNMQHDFLAAENAMRREETKTFAGGLRDIWNSGLTPERKNAAQRELNNKYRNGELEDPALDAAMREKQKTGLDYKAGLNDNDYGNKLATTNYFMEDLKTPQTLPDGSEGGGDGFKIDSDGLAGLVYIQSQDSGKENGANAGLTYNQAVDVAVEQTRAVGLFENDDSGIRENQVRTTAAFEIGEALVRNYINNSNLSEMSIFKTLSQDSKTFMDKQRTAALYRLKDKDDVPDTLIARARGELWNSIMDILGETGTAQANREALNTRIAELYKTYTDDKYRILRDNALSESTWLSKEPAKLVRALRLLGEEDIYNPGYHQAGGTGKGHLNFPENINDTARAVLEESAGALALSLGWENDGNTVADISGRYPVLSRGEETYRIIGRIDENGREALVIQEKITEDGKSKWEDAKGKKVNLDTRKWGDKVYDYVFANPNPVVPRTIGPQ